MDYLSANMAEFFKVLRASGINISAYDSITAIEALKFVSILDRREVKAALSACLAKSEFSREIFSKAFDLYFVLPDVRNEYIKSKADSLEKRKQEIEAAAACLKFQDKQIELTDELKEVFACLPDDEKRGLEDFLNTTSTGKNVRKDFKIIAEKMVKGKLENLKQKYRTQLVNTAGIINSDTSEAGIIAGEIAEDDLSSEVLLRKELGEISDEDVPIVIRLIRAMVDKLKRELERKYKRTGKRTRLDLKKTIRSNLSTGQVMFRLKYRSRASSKSKLLLLCDVSASMLRFSGFVLQFMIGMGAGFSSIESHIFSEDSEKINIKAYYGISDFEEQVKKSSIWGKGTNVALALEKILKSRTAPVTSSTILVIVSDAKTLDSASAEYYLKELSDRVKKVLWLNPIPEKNWASIKGITAFSEYCSMLDCSTLERLSIACSKL